MDWIVTQELGIMQVRQLKGQCEFCNVLYGRGKLFYWVTWKLGYIRIYYNCS